MSAARPDKFLRIDPALSYSGIGYQRASSSIAACGASAFGGSTSSPSHESSIDFAPEGAPSRIRAASTPF